MRAKYFMEAECGHVLEAEAEIPFVPVAGMMIGPLPEADVHEVEQVFWHCDEPNELAIWLKDHAPTAGAKPFPLSYYRKQGWRPQP